MSKYAGNILIVDDKGDVVFERELTADEMIDALLTKPETVAVDYAPGADDIVVTPKNINRVLKKARAYAKRGTKEILESIQKRPAREKECCGSKGARHFKWCKVMGGTGVVGLVKKADGRIPFSESTYNTVKSLFSQGFTVDAVVAEKGLDAREVQMIRAASNYNAYFKGW